MGRGGDGGAGGRWWPAPGRRGQHGERMACAACSGILVGGLIKTSRKCKSGEKVRSAMISTIYTIFILVTFIYSYYSAYFIFLHLKVKSENSINGRNTLKPLRRNGFGYTIFKTEIV